MTPYEPFLKFAIIPLVAWVVFAIAQRIEHNWWRSTARQGAGFVWVSSTVLLILSLPTGSIDISYLGPFLILCLVPMIPIFGFRVASKIRSAWIKIPVRIVSSLLDVLTVPIFSMVCLVEALSKRNLPIYSPDGKYLLLVHFVGQGALGDDYADVSVRRAWMPIATTVHSGIGGIYKIQYPEARWLESSDLLIRYREPQEKKGGRQVCKNNIRGLKVVCENLAVVENK